MSKKKYYAVVKGHKPGLYTEWFGADGAEVQIKGFPGAVYKGFQSRTEAKQWYNQLTNAEEEPPTQPEETDSSAEDYLLIHNKALAAGKVVLYTDGGSHGNPGKGGYGAVLLYTTHRKELSGGYACTTSNRMEIMACIAGLQALKQQSSVIIFSDSAYVVNSIQKGWATRWRANGWQRKQDGAFVPVRNADLWQKLLDLCDYHEVECVKVRGHAGIAENERCHDLASRILTQDDLPVDQGFATDWAE